MNSPADEVVCVAQNWNANGSRKFVDGISKTQKTNQLINDEKKSNNEENRGKRYHRHPALDDGYQKGK